MIDLFFLGALMCILCAIMKKHGTWKPGGIIGWAMACFLLLAMVKIPIYLVLYGFKFPYKPTDQVQILSGLVAVIFWSTMMYWRLPMVVIRWMRGTNKGQKRY